MEPGRVAAETPPHASAAKPKLRKRKGGLPTDFSDLDKQIEAEEAQKAEEERKRLEMAAATIDKTTFIKAWQELLANESLLDRASLQANMQAASYALNANKVVLTVMSEIAEQQIKQRQAEILEFLRNKCDNPTIFLEMIVDESELEKLKQQHLTLEDKKRIMEEKNPAFKLLQQKFKTQPLY